MSGLILCPNSNRPPIADGEVMRLLNKMLVPQLASFRRQLADIRFELLDDFGSRRLLIRGGVDSPLSPGYLIDAETSGEIEPTVYAILFSNASGLAEVQIYPSDLRPIQRQLLADEFIVGPLRQSGHS
jgi:hypothetical protein